MAIETINPTTHDSPDPAFGGNAMTSHSNTACSGGSIGLAAAPNNAPTYRAYSFPALVHLNFTERHLKFTYQVDFFDGTTGTVTAIIEYSLNGGGGWTTVVNLGNSGVGSTAFDLSLDPSQNLSNVQVRAATTGGGPVSGDERSNQVILSDIRIESTYTSSAKSGGGGCAM